MLLHRLMSRVEIRRAPRVSADDCTADDALPEAVCRYSLPLQVSARSNAVNFPQSATEERG